MKAPSRVTAHEDLAGAKHQRGGAEFAAGRIEPSVSHRQAAHPARSGAGRLRNRQAGRQELYARQLRAFAAALDAHAGHAFHAPGLQDVLKGALRSGAPGLLLSVPERDALEMKCLCGKSPRRAIVRCRCIVARHQPCPVDDVVSFGHRHLPIRKPQFAGCDAAFTDIHGGAPGGDALRLQQRPRIVAHRHACAIDGEGEVIESQWSLALRILRPAPVIATCPEHAGRLEDVEVMSDERPERAHRQRSHFDAPIRGEGCDRVVAVRAQVATRGRGSLQAVAARAWGQFAQVEHLHAHGLQAHRGRLRRRAINETQARFLEFEPPESVTPVLAGVAHAGVALGGR